MKRLLALALVGGLLGAACGDDDGTPGELTELSGSPVVTCAVDYTPIDWDLPDEELVAAYNSAGSHCAEFSEEYDDRLRYLTSYFVDSIQVSAEDEEEAAFLREFGPPWTSIVYAVGGDCSRVFSGQADLGEDEIDEYYGDCRMAAIGNHVGPLPEATEQVIQSVIEAGEEQDVVFDRLLNSDIEAASAFGTLVGQGSQRVVVYFGPDPGTALEDIVAAYPEA